MGAADTASPPARGRATSWWAPLSVGIVAGFLSGLFGVGGGILIVPALVVLLRMEQRLAHGTSLAATVPISAVALLGYTLDGSVNWALGGVVLAGSAVGVVGGTWLLRVLPQRALRLTFVAVLVATAARLLVATPVGAAVDLTPAVVVGGLALGVLSGVLAGLLGVGGGIIMVPAFVVLLGMADIVAKGTSLMVIIPTAMVGTLRNRGSGNVDLRAAVVVGLAGALSATAGVAVATRLAPRVSVALLALLLLATAGRLLWQDRTAARP